ncbi:hypothetical protein LQ953_04580 [Sphingomonas sp. IC-56]|uniref:hypothetical protein n=1 Tax=Sphingomonas sp. IC-56 TaxID=2898529 RepID=UPI001E4765A0|nr:hypothetical protein [Sphingomonas sp. IC-56]MCD2323290.1 hypothetical protein [Sphingomonas sp. IC-56]
MSTKLLGQAGRFLVAGIANTVMTLAIYQLLLLVLPPRPAYAVTWALGMIFVAAVYPSRVFGVGRPTSAMRIGVILVYIAGFASGLALIQPVARLVGAHGAIFPVLVFTTLFNFVAMRAVIGLIGPRGAMIQSAPRK